MAWQRGGEGGGDALRIHRYADAQCGRRHNMDADTQTQADMDTDTTWT